MLYFFSEGKQIIHPGQVQAVQEEFSPSPERVQWAKELISAFEQHQNEGKVRLLNFIFNVFSFFLSPESLNLIMNYQLNRIFFKNKPL